MRLPRILVALIASSALVVPALAGAASTPHLRFVECLTGKGPLLGEPKTPHAGGCTLGRTATGNGEETGIDFLRSLTASPDGRSLYAISTRDDAVSAFTTMPLRMEQCFTTNAHLSRAEGSEQPCTLLPNAGTEDAVSGFDALSFVVVSPDGRDVYTVAEEGSIGTFARDPSGRLDYRGCITGDLSEFGSAANGSCEPISTATDHLEGSYSGLSGPRSLAISPDGRFAYVALAKEGGIATLAREADGSLRFLSCLRGTVRGIIGGGAVSPCPLVAGQRHNPNGSGLSSPVRIAISPDGTSLYSTTAGGASIAEFRRDPASGALAYRGCLSAADRGTGPGDPCRYVPQADGNGVGSSMYGMREIAISPDGTGLYGISRFDDAVTAFARDPVTGRLSFRSCVSAKVDPEVGLGDRHACTRVPTTGKEGGGSGLDEPDGLAISRDGRSLFVASRRDEAIDRFRLGPGGALHRAGCITASPGIAADCTRARAPNGALQRFGFDGFDSLALAGRDLYAGAGHGSSITRFSLR